MGGTLVMVEAKDSKGGLLALQFAVQPYLTKTDEWVVDFCLSHFFRVFCCFLLVKGNWSNGFCMFEEANIELGDVGIEMLAWKLWMFTVYFWGRLGFW